MAKKFLSIVISIALLILPMGDNVQAAANLEVGDYVQFGKYYDEPILWRVINIDSQGDPLLFSDKIISIKGFDSKGPGHENTPGGYEGKERQNGGSNLWSASNIRQWLNSSEESIDWIQNSPSQENSYNNPYNDENGFLSSGNFSQKERDMIKPVTHKSILTQRDWNLKEGGSDELYPYTSVADISDMVEVVETYDGFNYQRVTDEVFLLDAKELYEHVIGNEVVLGEDYYVGRPTQSAVDNSEYEYFRLNEADTYWYWLRLPFAGDTSPEAKSSYVYYSDKVFVVNQTHPENPNFSMDCVQSIMPYGIRPALNLNVDSAGLLSGSGSKASPYALGAGDDTHDYQEYQAKENVELDKKWEIFFSRSIDASSVTQDRVYILDDFGNRIDCNMGFGDDNKKISIQPESVYEPNKTYQLHISKEIKSSEGEMLDLDIVMEFTTVVD